MMFSIRSVRSLTWPQHIRINQKDRVVDSAVFHDSLLIRAGLIVVGVIALLGLAWIVRSSLSPSQLPSSSAVQIASSATIPDSKGDPIEPLGSGVREAFVEARAEAGSEHLSSSTSNRPKLSEGASALAGSSMIGHLALGSLPDEMQVEVDPEIEVSAKTVGDLARWRHGVRICRS